MTRRLLGFTISLVVLTYIAQFTLRSQNNSAKHINASEAIAFRIVFGAGDKEPAQWNGSLQIAGGLIALMEGWRFGPGDQIAANGSWKLSTERPARGTETALGPIAEKAVVVTAGGASEATRIDV